MIWTRLQIIALIVGTIAVAPARAQTVTSLSATGSSASFGYDGLTFSISGCTSNFTDGTHSGVTASGACSTVEMTAISENGGAEIEFESNGTGGTSNVVSVTNGSGYYDIDFTLTVTGTGQTKISSVSAAVSGNSVDVAADLSLSGASNCNTTGGDNPGHTCNTFPYGGSSSRTTFSPVSSLSISYELGVSGVSGQTVTLSSSTTTFSPAREPAAIAILTTGLAGLAATRTVSRHRSRSVLA